MNGVKQDISVSIELVMVGKSWLTQRAPDGWGEEGDGRGFIDPILACQVEGVIINFGISIAAAGLGGLSCLGAGIALKDC
jgi:hypothetical protein